MKPTIALFVCDPKCSVQSSNGLVKSLEKHYNFKLLSKNYLEDNFFDDVDMIAVPGGFGDSNSYNKIFKPHEDRIKAFIEDGGKYLGICMGAYWAGKHYLNMLDEVDAVQYLKRPDSETKRPHAKNMPITWNGEDINMFWYDGCALVGNKRKFKTIATYSNGDSMAIIQGNVGLIGCHPESQDFWYDSYSWMKGKWHGGEHNKLLLDFANKLMEK